MKNQAIHVLVIEDDKQDFEYIKAVLGPESDPSFRLEHCTSLRQGVSQLETDIIDVVLLDLGLPDSYGYETFNIVTANAPNVPIILLTDTDNDQLAFMTAQKGAYGYLTKNNINRNLLVRTVYCALERDRLLRELEQDRRIERHLAYHDFLTKLPNRQLFYDRLRQAIKQGKRSHQMTAVLFIDLDAFKPINDFFGHETGDVVLKTVARRLRASVRETDMVARLGGDEFTIILEGISHQQDVSKISEKILAKLAMPIKIGAEKIEVSASIGISLFPLDAKTPDTLVRNADIGMYRAKKTTNTYEYYNTSTDSRAIARQNEEALLRDSIEKGEMVLHYQPQVDINSGRIVGCEALVRWNHSERGLLAPAQFIPLAEETGLIVPLGEWVLRTACTQAQEWHNLGFAQLRIGINLSARQFRVSRLQKIIEKVFTETGLNPETLVLEITETSVIHNINVTINLLDGLKELGVKIAIDDFGTGYATLNYLKRFPIDILKIDQSFIKGIEESQNDWSIVAAIIDMSHLLKVKVLAEGVEHAKQLDFLQALGCDEYQGFHRSQPVPVEDFTDILMQKFN